MKRIYLLLPIIFVSLLLFIHPKEQAASHSTLWDVQAVDTMKYSRDPSREKLKNSSFDLVIATQVRNIAKMGATHIAIATPYDDEFLPILKRWVEAARKNNLKIIFRGNLSGWEGWFGYPKIDRPTHIKKIKEFILKNPTLFENGDIFMGCPECENGGPGDPRLTGDVASYRQFLVDEHLAMQAAFSTINKKVDVSYNSMNGDVARLVMDPATTQKLGGIVVIDHYVKTPEQLASDIQAIAAQSGGSVVLGEFGAPILDINGQMTEDEQAQWLRQTMEELIAVPQLKGLSYWVNVGGSTSLYNDDGSARKAASVLHSFLRPHLLEVTVKDPLGGEIKKAIVQTLSRDYDSTGTVAIPVVEEGQRGIVRAEGYQTNVITFMPQQNSVTVVLEPLNETTLYKFRKALHSLFSL